MDPLPSSKAGQNRRAAGVDNQQDELISLTRAFAVPWPASRQSQGDHVFLREGCRETPLAMRCSIGTPCLFILLPWKPVPDRWERGSNASSIGHFHVEQDIRSKTHSRSLGLVSTACTDMLRDTMSASSISTSTS